MNIIRLFIVEDQPAILKSQIKLLGCLPGIKIIGTAMSGESAILAIKNLDKAPHVVLCDLALPEMSGIEVTRRIKVLNKKIEVLIFTVFEDEDKVLQAVKAGASGYLLKGAAASKIYDAIQDVFLGGSVIQPSLARKLLQVFSTTSQCLPTSLLSLREIECLELIAKGLSNIEIAGVLHLSKATIGTHLEHIYQKLDVNKRVEAVTEGIRQGIIEI